MELVFICVDNDLDYHIDLFLETKRATRRPDTVSWYRNVLSYYQDAIEDLEPYWPPTGRHALAFLKTFETKNLSEASKNGYYRAFRAFVNWLLANGFVHNNPLAGIDPIRAPKPLPKAPSRLDLVKLFATIVKSVNERWQNCRDLALFSLALDTGARIGELANILMNDVDLLSQQVAVYGTKDNAERVLHIGDDAAMDLAGWITQRSKLSIPSELNHLFVSDYNLEGFRPFTPSGMRQRLAVWQSRAGIRPFRFNGFRHAYAIYSLRNGADLLDIRDQLGHSSIETTNIYTQVVDEGRKERHRRTSPRRNL